MQLHPHTLCLHAATKKSLGSTQQQQPTGPMVYVVCAPTAYTKEKQ